MLTTNMLWTVLLIVVWLLCSWLVHLLTTTVLRRVILAMVQRSKTQWDDRLFEHRVYDRLCWLVPLGLLLIGVDLLPMLPVFEQEAPDWLESTMQLLERLLQTGMLVAGTSAMIALLLAVNSIYDSMPGSRRRPIKGYIQLVQIFVIVIGAIIVVAHLAGQSPWGLLAGLGTLTAVLLLIFKDTILGLVASMQLAGNDVVRVGDWITMSAYGADGDVIDIALHTVKVRNFDKTIVTVPTHKLVEGSVCNWRGMQESGGRRIKRNLHVNMKTVRFLAEDEIERLHGVALLRDYIDGKRQELEADKVARGEDAHMPVNIRRLTNIGTFRAYIRAYLKAHPQIHDDGFTSMVRQQEPTAQGLPLQVYVFTKTTVWTEYEAIQSDIFDHLIAIAPEFGLAIFQQPSGHDVGELLEGLQGSGLAPV